MAVTVASTDKLVAMIEAGAKEVSNDVMFNGIMPAMRQTSRSSNSSKEIQREVGREKIDFPSNDPSPELFEAVKAFAIDDVRAALDTDDKRVRDERLLPVYDKVHAEFDEKFPEEADKIDDCLYKLQKFVVRRWLLDDGKRVDGRGIDEIRPLAAEVDVLKRTHGSAMFTRGQTQVLTVTTLGPVGDAKFLTASMKKIASAICTNITSHPIRWVKLARAAAPAAAKLAMAPSQSAHCCR